MSLFNLKFTPQQRVYYGGIFLFLAVILIFLLPSELFVQGGLFVAASIVLFSFLINLRWGLYSLALFAFFSNWFISLGQYEWAKNISYLSSIDAPVVDFLAMLVAIGLGIAWLLEIYKFDWEYLNHIKKLIALYAIFVVWAALGVFHAYDGNTGIALKYLFRPIIFVFLCYVLLPNLLIRTKELLYKVITIWFWVGVGVALFGLSSLILQPQAGWLRVVPYSIVGVAPLGYNHNLIAEVLVALIPVGVYKALESRHKKDGYETMYWVGTGLMLLAELLTLSRAGWISVTVQVLLGGWLLMPYLKSFLQKAGAYLLWGGAVVGMVIGVYMIFFLRSSVVSSSDTARFTTTEIVWFYAKRSPLWGYGPGMYIPIFESTQDYVQEFGEALESHGFMQKILLEEGMVGLILFLSILLYVLWRLWRVIHQSTNTVLSRMFLVMVVGAMIFQLFNTSYFISVMWMPIGVALAHSKLFYKEV